MPAKTAKFGIQVDGAIQIQKALRVLGETDAPFLRAALEESGQDLAAEAAARAPGGIGRAVKFTGVKGKPSGLRAMVQVKHPGSRSMEFGRKWYGQHGRRVKVAKGQPARPYFGIVKGDAAIGATNERSMKRISDAIFNEWERIGREG